MGGPGSAAKQDLSLDYPAALKLHNNPLLKGTGGAQR